MTLPKAFRFAVTLALACVVSGVLLPSSVAAFEEVQQEDPSGCIAWGNGCSFQGQCLLV